MDLNRKIIYAAALVIVLLGITILIRQHRTHRAGAPGVEQQAASGGAEQEGPPPVPAGGKAADFHLQTLDGRTLSLHDLRGKVVFLNVWATWCGPCREEMPSMETLYDEMKDRKDFVMLAVSQDTRDRSAVESYVQKNGYHFTVLLDPQNKVGESYDVSGVPETFIIDRKGQIVAHHMGAFDWSKPDVKDALLQLLDSKEG